MQINPPSAPVPIRGPARQVATFCRQWYGASRWHLHSCGGSLAVLVDGRKLATGRTWGEVLRALRAGRNELLERSAA
jgi:hypothetical protein